MPIPRLRLGWTSASRLPAVFGATGSYAVTAASAGAPSSSSSTMPLVRAGSTWIPGPIVLVSVTVLM